MTNLEFCDKHNMVTYLKKPTGSEGFQEIVDFLNGSHIRYALTKNLTIYVSLIKKFWQTATVKTVNNREQEITTTVDGKNITVTEASVRRHLQLADADGISVLLNTKIFDQLSPMSHGGSIAQTRSERVPTPSYDSPLLGVHTPGSDKERFEQRKLTVLALEESKTAQDLVITRLKLKVKKLVKKKKKGRFDDETDFDEGFYKVQVIPTQTYTRRRRAISIGSGGNSTASRLFSTAKESVSTVGASMPVSTAGMVQEVNISIPSPVEVKDKEVGSSKRAVEAKLDYEGSKRQKTNEASGVGNHTEAYQFFNDMLKFFDMDDLVMLWSLVKERFSLTEPTDDKERTLWVKLKRLFEPDTDDTLWTLQRYMHDPLTWRLYDTCGVHHVSTEKGMDIFMLVEKECPLLKGVLTLMLVNKLLVDHHLEMANELLRKIFIHASRPKH
nr:xylulose kinase-1 [Tanacetum cinerariifolium]